MLEIKNLTKRFQDKLAVNNLSLSLPTGKVMGLLGRNGAGKTTTIKMLLGLLESNEGQILWNGKTFDRHNTSIGYLPEERGLYPKSKIEDQLLYFAKLEDMSKQQAKQQIDYWFDRLEMNEYRQKKASELSKGNQQKIQLIATLIHNPEFIILDEPFSGLDPINAELLAQVIQEQVDKGKTLILSSHRMEQIEHFCEYISIIKDGKLVLSGTLADIKMNYGYRNFRLPKTAEIEKRVNLLNIPYVTKHQSIIIKMEEETDALTLLNDLKENDISIRSFQLVEPTLHEIFVERAN